MPRMATNGSKAKILVAQLPSQGGSLLIAAVGKRFGGPRSCRGAGLGMTPQPGLCAIDSGTRHGDSHDNVLLGPPPVTLHSV